MVSLDIVGCAMVSLDIVGCAIVSLDIVGCVMVSLDIVSCTMVSLDIAAGHRRPAAASARKFSGGTFSGEHKIVPHPPIYPIQYVTSLHASPRHRNPPAAARQPPLVGCRRCHSAGSPLHRHHLSLDTVNNTTATAVLLLGVFVWQPPSARSVCLR
nr:hypothetical protein [Tanacetum cinerariifolium]